MSVKLKYISKRLLICAAAAELLLLLMTGYIWLVSLERSAGPILAAFFTLAVFLVNLLAFRLVVRPYRETKTIYEQFAMGHVLNDLFDVRYPYTPENEQAIRKFNEMIDRSNLVNVSKKQAEYLALQNQINPHFLYNTLEGIRSEALIAGLDSVAEMTEALATFFRYTISQVENLVPLEDELANIENYYYIQQFRFGDKLALSIEYDCDEDLSELDILQYRLPKLTLQPIVENSILHGFKEKMSRRRLTVNAAVERGRLVITVEEDGKGMTGEKLEYVRQSLELEESLGRSASIGLNNVSERCQLYFGESFSMEIHSRRGTGTRVALNAAAIYGEGEENDTSGHY